MWSSWSLQFPGVNSRKRWLAGALFILVPPILSETDRSISFKTSARHLGRLVDATSNVSANCILTRGHGRKFLQQKVFRLSLQSQTGATFVILARIFMQAVFQTANLANEVDTVTK
jgi:hypothetical protein